jgi:hypothetical protein
MINTEYLIALLVSWLVSGWIHMVQKDTQNNYDFVLIQNTYLYSILKILPLLMIIISLVINMFMEGFISTLIYVGIIILVQLANINILYYVYRSIFGRDGLGTLIPMLGIIPALIYMFIAQFS